MEVTLRSRSSEEFLCRVRSFDGLPLAHATVYGRPAVQGFDAWQALGSTNEQGELTASFGPGLGLIVYAERQMRASVEPAL